MIGAHAGDVHEFTAAPRFNGWLVQEEESDEAAADPAAAVRINRQTMGGFGA